MRGRKAASPVALITLAAALVLLTAVTSYIAYANTLKIHDTLRNNLKVEVEMRREPKVSILQGLPPGVSPKAYVVIHETSGYQEAIYDIVYRDNRTGNVRHARPSIRMNEGDCVILTPHYLASLGLPQLYREHANSTLVVHSSRAVSRGVPRELKPDEIYPCMRLGSHHPQDNILLWVMLDGEICTRQVCRNLLNPPARPTAYVRGAYTVFNITAAPTATVDGVDYAFLGWLVYVHPRQRGQHTSFSMNPLPLLVDDSYDVVAVYGSDDWTGDDRGGMGRNCHRLPDGEWVCFP